jgi:glycosyltransferase involved in cell wall biosynthesis
MKLLFITQVVDEKHDVLGAYHAWISKLAERFERLEVICLYEGVHHLPKNVVVRSLGKERVHVRGPFTTLIYILRFYRLLWKVQGRYDLVFVHMNQEYILLAGWWWELWGKPIYLWRNHYAGSFLTDLAVVFCKKVFCTSRFSYTARYRKTVFVPVGVDTERFVPDSQIQRTGRSVLFLARMAPAKEPHMLLEALHELNRRDVEFTATLVGSPLPEHESYYCSLKQRCEAYGLGTRVTFIPGVPNSETPKLYQSHAVFVNCSPSGMLDKTIFEAAACECVVLARSKDYADLAGPEFTFSTNAELAERLEDVLAREGDTRMRSLAESQSLGRLIERLSEELV